MSTRAWWRSWLVGLIVIAAGVTPARAASLALDPVAQTVSVGDAVEVAVTISGLVDGAAPSLGVFDLDVGFNAAVLSFVGAVYGDPGLGDQLDVFGLGSIVATTPGAGTVNLFELSLDLPSDLDDLQAGAFTLVTLTFDALAAGVSLLDLSVNALGDSLGDPLAATIDGGSVTVSGVAVPEPGDLLLLVSGVVGLAGAVWSRRRPV